MRIQMQRMTEGMEVKDDLARCLEKLEEAMSMLITIYDRIQQYQNEQILSNHIANVCSVSPSTLSISGQNLVNVTNNLEWSIRSSLVLKHYQTGLKAFKQWVFPFASHYLEESMIPSHFQQDGNIISLVNNAATEIESLKKKIDLYKASARDTDEILIRGEFNSRCISCEAFFAWKDEEYRYEISRLLSGRTIVLKADVKLSEPGKDAIKFKMIKLHLKSKNETLQSQLDETLKMFDVTATHIGNSYYRYHDEIYTITSPKKTIFYSFEENARTGNPVRKNEIYMKFKHGDLMLSPYTMWIFKLNATRGRNFRELDIYKGQIDLELEGEGGYVTNDFGYEDDDYEFDSQLETPVESELKNRIIRSLDRRRSESSVTSGSASSLSSPINSACNLFKTYTVYLITISINRLSNYGGRALKIDTIKNFLMTSMNSVHSELSNEIQKSNTSNISRFSLTKSFDTKEEFDLILKNPNFKSNDISCKYNIPKYLIANTKSNNFNENIKSFIFNEQESKYYDQNIQVPDLNHSLLFADFIARLFTGLKYETESDESLMSPKNLIFKRCNESPIKNENDIIKNFRLFSEKHECIDRSWLSSVKRNVKSVFQYLGLISKEETDECIRDIRNLFA
ncbi:unnamed protein product [Larinioides sclopetarius]|uniref:Uncharacterized protein n=1 Tax=Larinioides sclopetarius TaxID=280406 RepID=A0AAV1YR50_9ARAC